MNHQYQWTSNRSLGSFFDEYDLQSAFTYLVRDAHDTTQANLPNVFTSTFETLVNQINITPPHTSVTIVWNEHLPHYDSTCDIQEFKEFTLFPNDLPFNYSSLTV